MQLRKFINAKTLRDIQQMGGLNINGKFKLLDCTSNVLDRSIKQDLCDFPELMKLRTNEWMEYRNEHIEKSIHFDLNVATYRSTYDHYQHYPVNQFQNFVQLLGINKNDHLILYGRGPFGGMLFASRVALLLKAYGEEKLSILNGGLESWKRIGGGSTTDIREYDRGDWLAKPNSKCVMNFEGLVEKDETGKSLLENTYLQINLLDARPRDHFKGIADPGFDKSKVSGVRLPNSINAPAVELLNKDGTITSDENIKKWLSSCGVEHNKPAVTFCMRGLQSSFLSCVIEQVEPSAEVRNYSGSLLEIAARRPDLLSD